MLLNVKIDSLAAKFSKSRKPFFDIPLTKVSERYFFEGRSLVFIYKCCLSGLIWTEIVGIIIAITVPYPGKPLEPVYRFGRPKSELKKSSRTLLKVFFFNQTDDKPISFVLNLSKAGHLKYLSKMYNQV